jgi:hypothetical protein
MEIHCYTSFSFSYLAKARTLAASVKRYHPDWRLWAVISDREPAGFRFDIQNEDFDFVIWGDELFGAETLHWMFKHDVVEFCTAVKGPVLKRIVETTNADRIFYLDPDIAVFGSLQPLVDMLETSSILLTPHQLDPDESRFAIADNEICSLRLGIYNLGFVAIRTDGEGYRFARWWSDRLRDYCFDEPSGGLFVDQKWCDLVPAFFENVKIVRDPGCNVASWNLSKRKITIDQSGNILVNGSPLRFFHFTKLGPIGDVMTQRYAQDNVEVYELWTWYRHMVKQFEEPAIPGRWWKYSQFSNGSPISRDARILYRHRIDLQNAFPDPFDADGDSYYSWLQTNTP